MRASALLVCVFLFFSLCVSAQVTDFSQVDFRKADSVVQRYPNHSLRDLKRLAGKLTMPLPTEEEKFRAIYTWVCNNIEYDYALYVKNKQKEKYSNREELKAWNKKFSALVFKNLLNKQRTVCSGYAYLVRELASHAGLTCVIIDGYGRTSQANLRGSGKANHSWNAIQLNGKWYLCDATWSSGAIATGSLRFIKKFDASYFLADPALFVRNHYPSDSSWMLLQHKPTLKEFLNGPLIYSSAFKYKINTLLPETFDITTDRGKPVSFQFASNSGEAIEHAELYGMGIANSTAFYSPFYRDSTGLYCIDHTFSTKGTHLVHVLLNHSYAFTYTVKVR